MFVSQLRALSEHGNFNDMLEDMLQDRIVCDINDDTIQWRLLAERELSFKEALEVAQSMEMATRNVKELLKSSSSRETSRGLTGILKVNQSPGMKVTGYLSLIKYSTNKTAYTVYLQLRSGWLKHSMDYLHNKNQNYEQHLVQGIQCQTRTTKKSRISPLSSC